MLFCSLKCKHSIALGRRCFSFFLFTKFAKRKKREQINRAMLRKLSGVIFCYKRSNSLSIKGGWQVVQLGGTNENHSSFEILRKPITIIFSDAHEWWQNRDPDLYSGTPYQVLINRFEVLGACVILFRLRFMRIARSFTDQTIII